MDIKDKCSSDSGLVGAIQHYSTKDGPGIRTTAFMVGCNLRCLWCANPENMYFGQKVMHHKNLCQKCKKCMSVAIPSGSIDLVDGEICLNREICENIDEVIECCNYDAYEKTGTFYTPEQLAEKLLRDEVFYQTSSGGVTFSGGECLLQADFVAKTSKILRDKGVHVALDTAACVKWDKASIAFENCDLVLLDIKAIDDEIHKKCCGVSNKLILENAQRLAQINMPMIVRMVVVPGFNDDRDDVINRLKFISSLGKCVERVDILPYHKYGVGKYRDLDICYPLPDIDSMDKKDCSWIEDVACGMGLNISIGG